MAMSVSYELIEWAAAEVFGGELGQAFLGTQGDLWDAQKDMGLATLGAVLTMSVVACVNYKLDRHFAEDMRESIRVNRREPLGEIRLREMQDDDRHGSGEQGDEP